MCVQVMLFTGTLYKLRSGMYFGRCTEGMGLVLRLKSVHTGFVWCSDKRGFLFSCGKCVQARVLGRYGGVEKLRFSCGAGNV